MNDSIDFFDQTVRQIESTTGNVLTEEQRCELRVAIGQLAISISLGMTPILQFISKIIDGGKPNDEG